MGVFNEMLASAQRYDRWSKRQSQQTITPSQNEAVRRMEAERLRFSGLKDRKVDPGVCLGSAFEGDDHMPALYFEMRTLAARPVGQILVNLDQRDGEELATGFLVAPGLLLTNCHVLPSEHVAQTASVTFNGQVDSDRSPRMRHTFRLDHKSAYLADRSLDFCFVGVSSTSSRGSPLRNFGYLKLHAATGKILRNEFATIIQQPRSRQKHVVFRDSEIIVYNYDSELTGEEVADNNHIYYAVDTLPVSSGAPVFSDQWYVVALHRGGVPEMRKRFREGVVAAGKNRAATDRNSSNESVRFVANEGIRISRILRRVRDLSVCEEVATKATASKILAAVLATDALKDFEPCRSSTAEKSQLSESRCKGTPAAIPSRLPAESSRYLQMRKVSIHPPLVARLVCQS